MKETKESGNIYKITLLVSLSCVLQICESLIPHPIPGLRLGLANVITLIALINLGFGPALEITVLRTLLSSFIMGTFMSPGFILSFSAGIISTLVMGLFYWLSRSQAYCRFSIIGISIVGALSHNLTQIYLAYLILVKHAGIFVFLPWLCLGAVAMGWATGIIAAKTCCRLKEAQGREITTVRFQAEYSGLFLKHYLPAKSFLHRLSAEIKIAGMFILSLAVLVFNNFWLYLALSCLWAAMVWVSGASFSFLFSRARRYNSLIFVSFLFPVFFNSGKHILSQVAYLKITSEGLTTGVVFAYRILFLVLLSALLARTTSPKELSRGLARILSPFAPLGISKKRTAEILSLSWAAVPVFWEMARAGIRRLELRKAKDLCRLGPFLSDFIATLYLETEQLGVFCQDAYGEEKTFLREEVGVYGGNSVNG